MAASLLEVGNLEEDGCVARVFLKSLRKDGLGPGLIPGGKDGSCPGSDRAKVGRVLFRGLLELRQGARRLDGLA